MEGVRYQMSLASISLKNSPEAKDSVSLIVHGFACLVNEKMRPDPYILSKGTPEARLC